MNLADLTTPGSGAPVYGSFQSCAAQSLFLTSYHFLVLLMFLLQLQVVREKEKKPVRIGSGVQLMTVKL
jgi:hypothetical protein